MPEVLRVSVEILETRSRPEPQPEKSSLERSASTPEHTVVSKSNVDAVAPFLPLATFEPPPSPIQVPLQVVDISGDRANVGTAKCTSIGDHRLRVNSMIVDCIVSRAEMDKIAARFGVKSDLDLAVESADVWSDKFRLQLDCRFNASVGPVVTEAFVQGLPAPLEFSDQFFDRWESSSRARMSLDNSTKPVAVSFTLP
jgi:hypothetical protein